ncbi:tetratricopeptide repeat protein 17-like isoform X4 [Anthonomus grandis grandis]|nr:tetratricopeptide repeat protein 17-like isoform X4 [Anthonomus grandis grandis]
MKTLDEFGYFVVKALKENSTSWIHYNLASFYWRVKGKSQEAIDCLKLAIQFGQGIYQDIPLHNLAGILHHSRHPLEAIQLMNSAIKLAPNVPIHYFALGNIYASMTDFNNSIKNYDKCLELDPQNKEVANNRHAMLCYYKLENALTSFQNDLQNILSELHDYHSILQQWLRLQERLMWETATFNYEFDSMNPDMSHVSKKVQRCIKKTTGNKPIISCEFYDKTPEVEKLNLHSLFEIVENERQRLEQFNLETTKINIEPSKLGLPRFPTSMPTKANKYFDATGWPKKDECVEWALVLEDKDDLELPVFIPPDNKGYKLKKAITDDIGLPDYSQHDLPWYPPICEGENVNGEKFIPISEKNLLDVKYKSNAYLKSLFLKYLNDGNSDENEIGQRIITAMKKGTSPKWVLATLASLYWRVRGNFRRALDCLDMAFQNAPKDESDVVLVSIASTVYMLGLKDQCSKFLTIAFKVNYVEPATNFFLALLHYQNENPLLAIYYLKSTLRVEPDFYNGEAERLLKIWSCRIKLGYTLRPGSLI